MALIPDEAVYSSGEINGQTFKLYACLCAHRNKKSGKAWPDDETVKAETGIHPKYQRALMKQLVDKLWVRLAEDGRIILLKGFSRMEENILEPQRAEEDLSRLEENLPEKEENLPAPYKGARTRIEPAYEPGEEPQGSADADRATSARRPSGRDVLLFKRRDGLISYLKAKLKTESLPDLNMQKAAALWLVRHYPDEQCIEVLEAQWLETWRGKVDWATVKQYAAQYFARKSVRQSRPNAGGKPLSNYERNKALLERHEKELSDGYSTGSAVVN
jgi:hypothetical protein